VATPPLYANALQLDAANDPAGNAHPQDDAEAHAHSDARTVERPRRENDTNLMITRFGAARRQPRTHGEDGSAT
jgi:hypothetical protein